MKRKYPWEEWFSRPRTVLVRGQDYHHANGIMWQQIRNAVRRHAPGTRIRVLDRDTHIIIEVLGVRDAVHHTATAAVAP